MKWLFEVIKNARTLIKQATPYVIDRPIYVLVLLEIFLLIT
jgi:hypothetical protein